MDIKLNLLARYGTLVICIVFLVVGSLSWFVRYPEVVSTQAKLSGTNAPKPVTANKSGRLIALLHKDGSSVNQGDIIGVLETTADWSEVLDMSKTIDDLCAQLNAESNANIAQIMNRRFQKLGELQAAYQSFVQSYVPYRNYVVGGYAARKKTLLNSDKRILAEFDRTTAQQKVLQMQDINLSNKHLDNNEKLLKEKVISQQEYDQLVSQDLSKKMSLPQMRNTELNNQMQRIGKEKELLDLDNEANNQTLLFKQAAFNFKSAIDEWKKNYLLIAPNTGKLVFNTFLQENQQLEQGRSVGYVVSPNSNYYMIALVPQNNLGKIVLGQKVLLKFPAYPWQEFGYLNGKVDYISPLPTDSGNYIAKVSIPQSLETNFKKQIAFREGLQAHAEIVTKDMRLLERFYYDIVKQMKQ